MRQRYWLWSVLFAILLSACVSDGFNRGSVSAEEVARSNLELGREYYRRGQYEVALERLRKATAAQPQDSRIHAMLALTYAQLGDVSQSRYYHRRALQYVEPDSGEFGEISNNYGVFLCENTDYADAEEYFIQAAQSRRYSTPHLAYENAGYCAEKAGSPQKAISYYSQALELKPDLARSLLAMVRLNIAQQKYDAANTFLQRLTPAQADSAEGLWLAARIAKGQGDLPRAREIEQRLKSQFPTSPWAVQLAQP